MWTLGDLKFGIPTKCLLRLEHFLPQQFMEVANLFLLYKYFFKTMNDNLNNDFELTLLFILTFTHHISNPNFCLFCFWTSKLKIVNRLCPTHWNNLKVDQKTSPDLLVNSATSGQILQQLCPPFQYF